MRVFLWTASIFALMGCDVVRQVEYPKSSITLRGDSGLIVREALVLPTYQFVGGNGDLFISWPFEYVAGTPFDKIVQPTVRYADAHFQEKSGSKWVEYRGAVIVSADACVAWMGWSSREQEGREIVLMPTSDAVVLASHLRAMMAGEGAIELGAGLSKEEARAWLLNAANEVKSSDPLPTNCLRSVTFRFKFNKEETGLIGEYLDNIE